jgi:hypothetical protein
MHVFLVNLLKRYTAGTGKVIPPQPPPPSPPPPPPPPPPPEADRVIDHDLRRRRYLVKWVVSSTAI